MHDYHPKRPPKPPKPKTSERRGFFKKAIFGAAAFLAGAIAFPAKANDFEDFELIDEKTLASVRKDLSKNWRPWRKNKPIKKWTPYCNYPTIVKIGNKIQAIIPIPKDVDVTIPNYKLIYDPSKGFIKIELSLAVCAKQRTPTEPKTLTLVNHQVVCPEDHEAVFEGAFSTEAPFPVGWRNGSE